MKPRILFSKVSIGGEMYTDRYDSFANEIKEMVKDNEDIVFEYVDWAMSVIEGEHARLCLFKKDETKENGKGPMIIGMALKEVGLLIVLNRIDEDEELSMVINILYKTLDLINGEDIRGFRIDYDEHDSKVKAILDKITDKPDNTMISITRNTNKQFVKDSIDSLLKA